jgi:spermidine synthase
VKAKPVSAPTTTPVEAPTLNPGLRRYLYGTAAITGAVIMIVEILGAKMLSPYVGTSHFVWTAQIAVTLVALACGYYAGGRLVDRNQRLGRLYTAILVAGVYLALTVVITRPVAYACLQFSLPIGSLLSSAGLFFVPLALLAMVGPFFVRVLTDSVSGVGGNVGRLTAISTLGSFVGTVLIGYVLIPFLPNSVTMSLTALLLVVVASGYFAGWGRDARQRLAPVAVAAACAGLAWLGQRADQLRSEDMVELFRGNSNFGLLQVLQVKDSPRRFYVNDFLTQNTYDTNLQQSVSMFTYMLHGLARAYVPRIDQVLCIGVGVGIVPMEFAREGTRVDAVEINPAVVPVARQFFGFEPERLNLVIADGREFLNRCTNRYDAVVMDAFLGDSSPSHLMTREAFEAIRKVLRPEGVLVINTFAELERGEDFFAASLAKTLGSVFAGVRIHNAGGGNTLFVASIRTNLAILHEPDLTRIHPSPRGDVERAFAGLRETDPRHGRVLTDNFNPVEFYDAANRERTRRYLANAMREF